MKRKKGKVFFSFYFTGSPYMLHGHASVKDLTRGQTFWEGKAEGPIKGISTPISSAMLPMGLPSWVVDSLKALHTNNEGNVMVGS